MFILTTTGFWDNLKKENTFPRLVFTLFKIKFETVQFYWYKTKVNKVTAFKFKSLFYYILINRTLDICCCSWTELSL